MNFFCALLFDPNLLHLLQVFVGKTGLIHSAFVGMMLPEWFFPRKSL